MGLRASGKTTAGRAVARRRGVGFCDLDDLVAGRLGAESPGAALRERGEAAFRAAETACLRGAVTDGSIGVLALGGGTPTAPGAAELLKDNDAVRLVYLRADAVTLGERLAASGVDRPALRGSDPVSEIGRLLDERDALYRELADEVVEVGGLSIEELIETLA